MKTSIFLVILILGIAAARRPMRKLNCEAIQKMCERRGRRGNSKFSRNVCVIQDGEYKNYKASLCESKKAVVCDGAKMVHFGQCGNCTKENLCSSKMMDRINKKVEKICTKSGETYDSMCDYMVEKCNAAVEGRELPMKMMCREKKCEIIENACANCETDEEETPSNFLMKERKRVGVAGKGKGRGKGKGKQHGKRFGKNKNKTKTHSKKGRMCGFRSKKQVCLLSSAAEMKTTYFGKCGLRKDMTCGQYEVFHNGTCGNCTEANICPLKAELESLRERQESGINTTRIQNKIRKLERRFNETDALCMCKWGIAKCQAMKNMQNLPDKASIPECQVDEDEDDDEDDDDDEEDEEDEANIPPLEI